MFWRIGIMVQLIVHVSLKFFPEMSWPYYVFDKECFMFLYSHCLRSCTTLSLKKLFIPAKEYFHCLKYLAVM